jgi:hypothetical protein
MGRKAPPSGLKIDPADLTAVAEQLRWSQAKNNLRQQQEEADTYTHAMLRGKRYDDEEKIMILLDARHIGTNNAAAKYAVHRDILREWTNRLDTDELFFGAYKAKQHQINEEFEYESARAIKACLEFITRAAETCDKNNPAQIRAVAGAMKMAAEFRLADKITRAKLGEVSSTNQPLALSDGKDTNKYVLEDRFQKLEHINQDAEVESIIDGEFEAE